jgi:hypothetical protein
LFALAGATPAGATELQSGGTYVPIEALAAIAGTRGVRGATIAIGFVTNANRHS